MKIINKNISINKTDNLSVENIENLLISDNETPLRWSIVGSESNKLIIDAVLIKN